MNCLTNQILDYIISTTKKELHNLILPNQNYFKNDVLQSQILK